MPKQAVPNTERLFRWRGSKADQIGIEIFQHLCPEIINGAMAFIGYNNIKALNGEIWVIFNRFLLFEQVTQPFNRLFFQIIR